MTTTPRDAQTVEELKQQVVCPHGLDGTGHGYQAGGRYCDECGLWWPRSKNPRTAALDRLLAAVRAEHAGWFHDLDKEGRCRNAKCYECERRGLQERIKFTESFEAVVQRAEAAEQQLALLQHERIQDVKDQEKAFARSDQPQLRACEADPRGDQPGDSLLDDEGCPTCGGTGELAHDCGEDTCCCLDKDGPMCPTCGGMGCTG